MVADQGGFRNYLILARKRAAINEHTSTDRQPRRRGLILAGKKLELELMKKEIAAWSPQFAGHNQLSPATAKAAC
jgi:hypothetical protein